jgi:hypothetical protein
MSANVKFNRRLRRDLFEAQFNTHIFSTLNFFTNSGKKPTLGGNTLPFRCRIFALDLYKEKLQISRGNLINFSVYLPSD